MCQTKVQPQNQNSDDDSVSKSIDTNRPVLLKFWQIKNMFKCPVVGMCLTYSEKKQLLKKAGISIKKKSQIEIHEKLVASSDDENRLSRKVDNLLKRKFSRKAAHLLSEGHQKFMNHWWAAFETEEFQAALWAAAAIPDLPLEYRREIFGAVHMTMHWTANQSIKLKQKLAAQQAQNDAMHQAGKEAAAAQRKLRKENNRLQKSEANLKFRLASMEAEIKKLNDSIAGIRTQSHVDALEKKNQRLLVDLNQKSTILKAGERQVAFLQEENASLITELEKHKKLARHLSEEVRDFISNTNDLNHCDESCPTFNLCQKRILIVGGITRMEALYRRLIEDSGAIFEYHDGYMKKGTRNLENRLRRADMVLCPVSCNSHAACTMVKNLAKKHNKPLHMLANSSLSTVSQVIRGTGTATSHAVIN